MTSLGPSRFAYIRDWGVGASKELEADQNNPRNLCMVQTTVSEKTLGLLLQAYDRVELVENIDIPCRRLNTDKHE